MHMAKTTAFVSAALFMCTTAATAQVTVGLGGAVIPQFEGSKDYGVQVAPNLSFKSDQFSVRSNGPGVEIDVLPSRAIDAGPIVRYNFGRDPANIDNVQVKALPKIDGGLELGAYAQLNFPVGGFDTFVAPRLSVVQGVQGGARGTLVEASVGLTQLQDKWTLGTRAAATYASSDYMNDRFSVAAGSASGLNAFTADAGIKDVGLSLFANYKLNDQVSVTAVAGYKVLMGDAARSPIVSVAGSKNQVFISLGLSYQFN